MKFVFFVGSALLTICSVTPSNASVDPIARGLAAQANKTAVNNNNKYPHFNLKTDCGAQMNGTSDDTPAFVTCMALMPTTGGVIDVPPGIVTANLVIKTNGVTIQGSGWGYGAGKNPPTSNYWHAYDATKPIIQLADNASTLYSGILVRDVALNCQASDVVNGRSADIGLRNANGSYKNHVEHVEAMGCLVAGIQAAGDITGTSTVASAKVSFTDIHIACYTLGSICLDLNDPNSTGTVFNNDHQFSNLTLTGSNGAVSLHVNSSTAQISNMKMDTGGEGGVVIEQSSVAPLLYLSSSSIDSASSSDTLVIQKGVDPTTTRYSNWLAGTPIVDGTTLAVTNQTTGTPSGTTLTVSSATGFSAGKRVMVRTTIPYSATIISVSGTTVTLDKTATGTGSSVEVDVGYDEQGTKGFNNVSGTVSAASLSLSDSYTKEYGTFGVQPVLFGSRGGGAIAPYNTTDAVWELGSNGLDVLQEVGSGSITSAVRTGNTVAVTTASGHGLKVGDLIVVRGVNEQGFNGTYVVQSVPSTTTLTYTSGTSATTTATGTITFRSVVDNLLKYGTLNLPRSLNMKGANGFQTVLNSAGSSLNDLMINPVGGVSSGSNVIILGYSNACFSTTTECVRIGNGSTYVYNYAFGGNGGMRIGGTSSAPNTFNDASIQIAAVASAPTNTVATNTGLFYNIAGVPSWRVGTVSNSFKMTNSGTATVSNAGTGFSLSTGANQTSGTVTEGSGATGATITFGTSFTNPWCRVTSQSGIAISYNYDVSGLSWSSGTTIPTGSKFDYDCHEQGQ